MSFSKTQPSTPSQSSIEVPSTEYRSCLHNFGTKNEENMSTPRVSRTLARAFQSRMGASSAKCYTMSHFSTSSRNSFSAQIRDGELKSTGILGRESARHSRQVRSYSQESEAKSKYYTFEDVRSPAARFFFNGVF